MALCKLTRDAADDGFTLVDNRFIREHLPDADGDALKVYLYGLWLCRAGAPLCDNTLERMSDALGLTAAQVTAAFEYWRDQGLVTIVNTTPLEVAYVRPGQSVKMYKPAKFADFNAQLQRIFDGRMLLESEFLKYYEFLDDTRLPQEVLLLIAAYCVRLKGDGIRTNYVLAVARAWYALGIRTVEDAERHIDLEDASTESLRKVAKELGKKSAIDLDDKQLYVKWTSSWGFSDEAILAAAKLCKKRGGMERLDALLDELFTSNRLDAESIRDYGARKQELYELAKDVTRIIGVRYENLDTVISHYIGTWQAQGFDGDALKLIAEYCFSNGIRTLSGMNAAVARFYKHGCLSVAAIDEYLTALVERDKAVKAVIEATGSSRAVTASDRDAYELWLGWGFGNDAILAAARAVAGRPMAFGAISKILTDCRDAKVFDAAEVAKRVSSAPTSNRPKRECGDLERKYTKEELSSFFGDLHDFDNIEV